MHGTYIGPLQHLRGQTAMLRKPPEQGFVLAQFDNRYLTRSGKPWPKVLEHEPHARFPTPQDPDEPPQDALGFGWHVFRENEFQLRE